MMRISLVALAAASTLMAGCGGSSSSSTHTGDRDDTVAVAIPFTATVGTEPFACGQLYNSVGTTSADVIGQDARLYVHNVRFVTNDEREIPVTLSGDIQGAATANQKPGEGLEGIALLDLRDKSEGCQGDDANPDYYDTVTGTAAIRNESIRALRFSVGVPARYNHIDAQGTQPQTDSETGEPIPGTLAVGPLAAAGMGAGGMHWSWAAGYVHARLEVQVPTGASPVFYIHLGSTACSGEAIHGERTCEHGNKPDIEVTGFDPALHAVNLDLLALLSGNDVTINQGGPGGCMSGLTDADCVGIFERLGLPFPDADPDADHAPVFQAITF